MFTTEDKQAGDKKKPGWKPRDSGDGNSEVAKKRKPKKKKEESLSQSFKNMNKKLNAKRPKLTGAAKEASSKLADYSTFQNGTTSVVKKLF